MNTRIQYQESRLRAAFSLIELLVAVSVLMMLLVMLLTALSSVSSLYLESEKKVQAVEGSRSSLELMTREMTPAVVDTRMQFIVMPGQVLEESGAIDIAPESPVVLWMSPLGKGGDLRCVGYYLDRNTEQRRYRLKRIYIRDDNPDDFFPTVVNKWDSRGGRSMALRTDPVSAKWFTERWTGDTFDSESADNDKYVVSTVAEGVIAFWVQPLDLFGNAIPWMSNSVNHPSSELIFNSAAYFQMANTSPFDDGNSFVYLSKHPMAMKAHRLPPEVEIAMVMVGKVVLNRGLEIPEMINSFNPDGSLNLRESLDQYLNALEANGIRDAEAFTVRVKLTNGG